MFDSFEALGFEEFPIGLIKLYVPLSYHLNNQIVRTEYFIVLSVRIAPVAITKRFFYEQL